MKLILPVLLSTLLVPGCHAKLASKSDGIKKGNYTLYYDDATSCETMLFLGVGTDMKTNAYSELAELTIVEDTNTVVVIMDHNPGGFVKTDAKKYGDLLTQLYVDRAELVSFCGAKRPEIIISGHSASGQAAVQAMEWLRFQPELNASIMGFLGLAPYDMSKCKKISVPTLIWDSSKTSCAVVPKNAGALAFKLAEGANRAFFELLTGEPHCVYTNWGCPSSPLNACNPKDMQWVKKSVAQSIKSFVAAIRSAKGFDEAAFANVLAGIIAGQVQIHVNASSVTSLSSVEMKETVTVEL